MNHKMPVGVFPPGNLIREELQERGWTQEVLAEILDTSPRLVSEVISGKRAITPATANALGEAFGTGPIFWMNLESAYRVQLSREPRVETVARRAKLYSMAPIREMIRRHWIEEASSIAVLEERVMKFFRISSLDQTPQLFPHNASKSTPYESTTPAQRAWLFRARSLAEASSASPYTGRHDFLNQLRTLAGDREEARRVPRLLSDAGIRLVLVEALPSSKIDGAAFWLNANAPVVALSLRYDRIDAFWHHLVHELRHIINKDAPVIDVDMGPGGQSHEASEKMPEFERRAHREAADFLVPRAQLDNFIARVHPLYSKQKIRGFAATVGVHPGIVVGQLQNSEKITYAHNREMLEKIRDVLWDAALTDGWGHAPSIQ